MTDPTKHAVVFVVGCWAALGLFLAVRRRREPLWAWVLGATVAGAAALARDTLVGLVPFAACVVAIVLPDGVVAGRRHRQQRVALVLATIVAVPCAIVLGASGPSLVVVVVETAVLAAIALTAYVLSCRSANALDRARLQWAGWGVVVAGAWALVTWLMHALIGWPAALGVPVVLGTAFVPLALAFASVDSLARRVDRLLVQTIEVGGLIVLVGVIYLVVVLGFGDSPNDATQRVLGLSIVAAGIAAACFVPARDRLEAFANRRVYGEQRSRDEPLQTFGARMSRAIPLDELLLQLAESLKKSMQLVLAEVWTGAAGVFERAAAVPYRDVERVKLTDDEIAVVARAHTQGNAWIQVWLPQFLDQNPGRVLRVAPLVHSGELLGLVVCGRSTDQQPFGPDDDRVLTELARQVALALHNSALDTALQASLDELRIANEELRASRARIVATGDQARRQIERNLHDGAQQHLVALAVKLGLARQLVDGDTATVAAMLEELRGDVQATLTELRELAHGIYPPLLMDRGLGEALRAAANRSILAAEVRAEVGRFSSDVEAAVYFCCLEALQNAGKHAGAGARVTITVHAGDGRLCFEVADDGAGFDPSTVRRSHGFVNMEDRLGAIGGSLTIDASPGHGARVRGEIPLQASQS